MERGTCSRENSVTPNVLPSLFRLSIIGSTLHTFKLRRFMECFTTLRVNSYCIMRDAKMIK